MNEPGILRTIPAWLIACLMTASAHAQDVLHVYGPGGPAPAMTQAAAAFGKETGVRVVLTAGPTPQWKEQAQADADLIYSGSEHMMSDFGRLFEDLFELHDVVSLYLRPSAILVRPGNPKGIAGFRDLLKPDIKVLAVAGAGQTGLWEDMAGRAGRIDEVRALRRNLLLPEAPNSGIARQLWQDDASIDAWLIWNIWQLANPQLADLVAVEPEYTIWRDTGIVVTRRGKARPQAAAFVEFLLSETGQEIFAAQGWRTH